MVYTDKALKDLKKIHDLGKDDLLICMAKTQASISDDPNKKGRPTGFKLTVREVRLSAGAGFIIPITGSIMTMPGLPKRPRRLQHRRRRERQGLRTLLNSPKQAKTTARAQSMDARRSFMRRLTRRGIFSDLKPRLKSL